MFGILKDSTAAGGAALIVIAILTIPAIIDHVARLREKKEKACLYEDDDGIATEESIANYSTVVPKVLLGIFTTLGLLTAIALAVLAIVHQNKTLVKVEDLLNVAAWVRVRDARSENS